MRRDIPDRLKAWLHMGGRLFFAWTDAERGRDEQLAGYIRAYNRAGALRIAKSAGVTLGRQMKQRDVAPMLETGKPEIGGTEVYRGNPKGGRGASVPVWAAVPADRGPNGETWSLKNTSGGVEGFLTRLPAAPGETHPYKVWGRTYGGTPRPGTYYGAVYGTLAEATRKAVGLIEGTTRENPGFDGSKRQAFAAVPPRREPAIKVGARVCLYHAPDKSGAVEFVNDFQQTAFVRFDDGRSFWENMRNLRVVGENPARGKRRGHSAHVIEENPALVVMGNPGRGARGARVLSRHAIAIQYVHATDGKAYSHKFGRGDEIILAADGKSFTVRNKNGKRLWKDF